MPNYSAVEIYPKKPSPSDMNKKWRVRFRFLHAGKWHQVSRKEEINSFKSFRERLVQATGLKNALTKKLRFGWNPITGKYDFPAEDISVDVRLRQLKEIGFNAALDYAYDEKLKDWKGKTSFDYKSVKKYLKQAAKILDIHDKPIAEFGLAHFKIILNKVTELRNLSAKGFNKYREYLSSLVGELIQWEIVELNYVHHVKTKDVPKTVAHRPPTSDQQIRIVSEIKKVSWPYYRFVSILYGCAMRPKETTCLKIKHLHKVEQCFRLTAEDAKDSEERDIAIPDWVMGLLSEMNLHNYNPEFYIFSTRNKYGSFMPGPNKMHPNTTNNTWRKIVKVGLKLDVDQYSLKKLSGDDMVRLQRREGINNLLELPMSQMGHSNQSMTEVYVSEHHNILQEIVKRKMPML